MKVKVNKVYKWNPCAWDTVLTDNPAILNLKQNELVRVVNLYGCPPANARGNCYIAPVNPVSKGEFYGMVSTNSLEPL